MTTFMIFDYIGRQISGFKWANKWFSLNGCLAVSIVRLAFFALFVLEAIPKYKLEGGIYVDGPYISVDEITILTMLVFALSNGWSSSITMMKFMEKVPNTIDYSLASNIQTFMLNSGLFAGGLCSLGIAIPFSK